MDVKRGGVLSVNKGGTGGNPNKYIKWFSELSKDSVGEAGGKGANLGEMYNNKFPVPPGFVIISDAYKKFMHNTGLENEIYTRLNKLDTEKTRELEDEAKKIRDMIENEEMPKDMHEEIIEAYEHLNIDEESLRGASKDALAILKKGHEPPFVAVRSSATSEDSAEASFAGQQATFLNTKGDKDLILAVKACWASLFTARSIYYRIKKGFKHEETAIAVVVQMMVNPEKSGIMFTHDPVKESDNVVIEAVFGLGEGIVSGMIAPDHYEINREGEILATKLANKKIALVRNSSGKNEKKQLSKEVSESQVLTNYEIKRMAQYGIEIEQHYSKPQDIEFAIDSQKFYIVQTRPITTLATRGKAGSEDEELSGEVALSGMAASPGIGSGPVRIVHDISELDKIQKGDILITEMTNPDMVVAMQKAAAILTDEGGLTAHAAIVSREMGIPAIVGSRTATTTFADGEIITVDGYTGKVYRGKAESKKVEIKPITPTKSIKIKVIVDLPDFAERAALSKATSVGLTRLEGIIAEGGKHPQYFLKSGEVEKYEELIFKGIKKICEYFEEVWVRTSDIRSDEYENLEGAPKDGEANPMMGMHGIRASLKYPELLKAELRALKRVAEGGKKIGVMMPQVISVEEVQKTKEYMESVGLHDNFKLGVMIETPAAVQIIKELCDQGIKFASFGTNDLTQFTLALDRGNEDVQPMYNEMHPAILRQLAYVIKVCKERGVVTSICGQAGSRREMAEFLFKEGINSISVNADAAADISEFISELEGKQSGSESKPEDKPEEIKEEEMPDEEDLVSSDEVANEIVMEEPTTKGASAQPIQDYSTYKEEEEEPYRTQKEETSEERHEENTEKKEESDKKSPEDQDYADELLKELESEDEEGDEDDDGVKELDIF